MTQNGASHQAALDPFIGEDQLLPDHGGSLPCAALGPLMTPMPICLDSRGALLSALPAPSPLPDAADAATDDAADDACR